MVTNGSKRYDDMCRCIINRLYIFRNLPRLQLQLNNVFGSIEGLHFVFCRLQLQLQRDQVRRRLQGEAHQAHGQGAGAGQGAPKGSTFQSNQFNRAISTYWIRFLHFHLFTLMYPSTCFSLTISIYSFQSMVSLPATRFDLFISIYLLLPPNHFYLFTLMYSFPPIHLFRLTISIYSFQSMHSIPATPSDLPISTHE